jgi:cytochrome d ubiquinol oxidase subunit I
MFHYLFPPLTIGLGVVLVILEGLYLKTRKAEYAAATRFWIKIFALNFAMGVVTGIVMEFQFGTNWSSYSRFVGDVFGSALAAEGIFAFFLESGFLAVLVFGWNRVSPRMHFFSTVMVALGSIFSSVWIVVANSWQQTPAGYHIVNGRAEITDFWDVVFNPSTMYRLVHVLIGAFILGAFFVMSITAYYLLRGRHEDFARRSFSAALPFAALASLAALFQGHFQARNVYEYQPAKLAAFEGLYKTTEGAAELHLFGIPDDKTETVKAGIAVPGMLSFLIHDDFKTPVIGLDAFPPEHRPPVAIPFYSYHLMVTLGIFFIVLTLLALILKWTGRLYRQRWLMWIFVFAVLGPYVANQVGWVAAEVGRQPWIVHPPVTWTSQPSVDSAGAIQYDPSMGLRTDESVSPSVAGSQVLGSIIMFGLIYLLLFVIWVYLMNAKIHAGPMPPEQAVPESHEHFIDTAARFAGHGGESLTDAHSPRADRDTANED